eukprot:10107361-Lingulodinium_polyedra.AAC.1
MSEVEAQVASLVSGPVHFYRIYLGARDSILATWVNPSAQAQPNLSGGPFADIIAGNLTWADLSLDNYRLPGPGD